ncbi:MAG: hypothetical protein MR983_02685 [Succinatimonas sp.]|nr:hypothetical protein [Succinatimonas sp.]
MITGVVFILIIVAIEVFDKLFGDDLNPHFYIVIMLIALISILALERCAEQNKFTNSDSQETPAVTQESSQVKVKENTMNLNCTALENGEYLCKKPK